jgi:hypothetical protein
MSQTIQFRRNTNAGALADNPVLFPGEPAWTLDTPKLLKIGDGVTHWKDLPPVSSLPYGWFNVRDYGAKGDNTTDDTAAIEAAKALAEAIGGVVFFPTGIYRVANIISPFINASMRGSGCTKAPFDVLNLPPNLLGATIIVQNPGATGDLITYNGALQMPTFADFTLVGSMNSNQKQTAAAPCVISALVDRRHFICNNTGIPDYSLGHPSPLYYGWAFIYDGQNYIGSVQVGSITDNGNGTSTIGIIDLWDNFCSKNGAGGNFWVGLKVSFSPYVLYRNVVDASTISVLDPARAGYVGMLLLGDNIKIQNVSIFGFHNGIACSPFCQAAQVAFHWSESHAFSAFSNPPGYGADHSLIEFFTQGFYHKDWANPNVGSNTYFDTSCRYQLFGIFAPPANVQGTNITISAVVVGIWQQAASNWSFGNLTIDSPARWAIYSVSGRSTSSMVNIDYLLINAPGTFYSDRGDTLPFNRGTPSAIFLANTPGALFKIGTLNISYYNVLGATAFQSCFDITNNTVISYVDLAYGPGVTGGTLSTGAGAAIKQGQYA